MGRRSGKKSLTSLFSKRTRSLRRLELPRAASPPPSVPRPPAPLPAMLLPPNVVAKHNVSAVEASAAPPVGGGKNGKKKAGSRLWMRFDRAGETEMLELDKGVIIRRAGIPPRDLRILGPLFSHSSNILAREKAMVVNLEFIKAIVTADEALLLDPLCQEVIPFVDQLRQLFPMKSPRIREPDHVVMQCEDKTMTAEQWHRKNEAAESERKLPFEFQVLEIALETVCTYLDSGVADLENVAYPVLDELAINVSTKNLERVRSLKSDLTHILARVQKVRDEIEHLLDDNEDMAHLYLTRKQIQNQQFEALIASAAPNSNVASGSQLAKLSSNFHGSTISSIYSDDNDVEDLEMLLEAYFMQLDGTRNKILSVREYIDDTEDYVNIQLDNQRNELIQLQLVLTMLSFAIAIDTLIVGAFAMNLKKCKLYDTQNLFIPFVAGTSSGSLLIFLLFLGYARWKKLLGP